MAVQHTSGAPVARPGQIAPLFASYLALGFYWGVWVVVFADYLAAHGLTEGEAGFQLGVLAVVSILTMTLVSPRLQRLPLATTLPLGLLAMGAGALSIANLAGGWLYVAFVPLGVGNGLLDVFANVGAQGIEARTRRPVLQFLHASYSAGGLLGALGAGFARMAGLPFRAELTTAAGVCLVVAGWNAGSGWLRDQPSPAPADSNISLSVFLRSRVLIVPAIVVLAAFTVEGSMDIWSVIYLRKTLEASVAAGGIAFAAFSLAMGIGRLTAGRLLFGLGYRATMRVSGVGSLASGLAAALTHSTVIAGVAFLFLGFFIASAAPAAFGSIADTDEEPALAIAAMTTVGYSGFVVGPPIMGWLAETAGLRVTMVVLVLVSLGVAAGGIFGRNEHGRPGAEPGLP